MNKIVLLALCLLIPCEGNPPPAKVLDAATDPNKSESTTQALLSNNSAFDEYLCNIYGIAGDLDGFSAAYRRLINSEPAIAKDLLEKYIHGNELKKQVKTGQKLCYTSPGMGKFLGLEQEWPNSTSKLLKSCQMARKLLENKEWTALEHIILDEIITDPDYAKTRAAWRLVVAGGLAILDFKNKYPNCVSPWKLDEQGQTKLSLKRRARILYTIMRLRAKHYLIPEPAKACEVIDIQTDKALCVRVLVAGGYARAYELLHYITADDDEMTMVTACHYLEYRGPKAALSYYEARLPQVSSKMLREYIAQIIPILQGLRGWHDAAKQLSTICPCRQSELPIARRVLKVPLLDHQAQSRIRNLERMFWVLQAAQYRDKAREMLDKLNFELEPKMMQIGDKKAQKIKALLEEMFNVWEKTKTIPPSHIANLPKPVTIEQFLAFLLEGNLVSAQAMQDTLFGELAKTGKYADVSSHPTFRFFNLLITAYRNPQLLNPPGIRIFRPDDWQFNWYVAQSVDHYLRGDKYIELLDKTVPKPWNDVVESLILFFAGRYGDVLEMAKHSTHVLKEIVDQAKICHLRRDEFCANFKPTKIATTLTGGEEDQDKLEQPKQSSYSKPLQEYQANVAGLMKALPQYICPALQKARAANVIHVQVFQLSQHGAKALAGLGAETYLQPPLPSEIPIVPKEMMHELRTLSPPPTLDTRHRELKKQLREKLEDAATELSIKNAQKPVGRIIGRIEKEGRRSKKSKKQVIETKEELKERTEDKAPKFIEADEDYDKVEETREEETEKVKEEEKGGEEDEEGETEELELKGSSRLNLSKGSKSKHRIGKKHKTIENEVIRSLRPRSDIDRIIQVFREHRNHDSFDYPLNGIDALRRFAEEVISHETDFRNYIAKAGGLTFQDMKLIKTWADLTVHIASDRRTYEIDPQSMLSVLRGLYAYKSYNVTMKKLRISPTKPTLTT